jgi:hypothetical protein
MSCRAIAHLDAELQTMAPVSVAGKERHIHKLTLIMTLAFQSALQFSKTDDFLIQRTK